MKLRRIDFACNEDGGIFGGRVRLVDFAGALELECGEEVSAKRAPIAPSYLSPTMVLQNLKTSYFRPDL